MTKVKLLFALISFLFIIGPCYSQSWTYYHSEKRPSAVIIDSLNNKWIAYSDGLEMYDDSLWTDYKQPLLFVKKALYHNGNIWLINGNGDLIEFDASTWTQHVIGGFFNESIRDMAFSQNGTLWIGTSGSGLYRYDGNSFGIPSTIINSFNSVYALAIDANDSIEISCEHGLMKMSNQALDLHSIQPDSIQSQISTILIDKNKKYYTTNEKLYYYNDSILQVFTSSDTALNYPGIGNLQKSANGSIWMNSNRYLYELDTLNNFTPLEFYSTASNLFDFSIGTNNVAWVTGNKGAFSFINNQTTSYNSREIGLDYHNIRDIEFDKDGNTWVISWGKLIKYNGNEWVTISDSLGYYAFDQNCLAIGPNNEKWIGTDNGLLKIDSSGMTVFHTSSGLNNSHINDIEIDQYNKVWIATEGGVTEYNGTNFTHYSMLDGLPDNTVNDIYIDPNGTKWVGTENGVAYFNGVSWDTLSATAFQLKYINAIAQDNQGHMWFGTNTTYSNWIYEYDGNQWITHSSTSPINSIYCDPSGVNYFAKGNGFYVLKNNSWKIYYRINGLLFSGPNTLSMSPTGSLWIGCYNGISVFDPGPVSINPHIPNKNLITVFPNPCREKLLIQCQESSLKTIELIDLNGKSLMKLTSNEIQINLNISRLSRGVYLLRIQTDNLYQTQKIIKN